MAVFTIPYMTAYDESLVKKNFRLTAIHSRTRDTQSYNNNCQLCSFLAAVLASYDFITPHSGKSQIRIFRLNNVISHYYYIMRRVHTFWQFTHTIFAVYLFIDLLVSYQLFLSIIRYLTDNHDVSSITLSGLMFAFPMPSCKPSSYSS